MTGIDLGLKDLAIESNGTKEPNPRHLKKAEKHLRRVSKKFSRTKKGSRRHEKARFVERTEQLSDVLGVARAQHDVGAVTAQDALGERRGKVASLEAATQNPAFKPCEELFRRVERRDAAFLQDRDAPAERLRFGEIVVVRTIV